MNAIVHPENQNCQDFIRDMPLTAVSCLHDAVLVFTIFNVPVHAHKWWCSVVVSTLASILRTSVDTQQWAQPVTAGVHGVSSKKCS